MQGPLVEQRKGCEILDVHLLFERDEVEEELFPTMTSASTRNGDIKIATQAVFTMLLPFVTR